MKLGPALKHPLFILAATALISGLAIPRVTQDWQDRQRVAEQRAQILADSGRAVARFLVAMQFDEFGGAVKGNAPEAYKAWEVDRLEIEVRLRAHRPSAVPAWTALADTVSDLYIATRGAFGFEAKAHDRLRRALGSDNIGWQALRDGYRVGCPSFDRYREAWFALKAVVLNHYESFSQKVLAPER